MAIDVLNHIWVGVFSASFVQQYADEGRRQGSPGTAQQFADQFVEEACAVADVALVAYGRTIKPGRRS